MDVLKTLLERGLDPNDQENGGCSAIQHCLDSMDWGRAFRPWSGDGDFWHDDGGAREKLRAIHLLAKHGGKWAPGDKYEVNAARRCLLKLPPDYTVEFVWIMSKYRACAHEHVESLLRTPRIKSHVSPKRQRLAELSSSWA